MDGLVRVFRELVGLGGSVFRLPFLLAVFGFAAPQAVILNKSMSLVMVTSTLGLRSSAVSPTEIAAHWMVIINLLAGSLVGAWSQASRPSSTPASCSVRISDVSSTTSCPPSLKTSGTFSIKIAMGFIALT